MLLVAVWTSDDEIHLFELCKGDNNPIHVSAFSEHKQYFLGCNSVTG